MARTFPPLAERLAERAVKVKETGCIEWLGTICKSGYGYIRDGSKRVRVHRVAYELKHGPIPIGLMVCHTCDNRKCINVEHHFLGRAADNVADKVLKGRQAKGIRHGLRGSGHPSARLCEEQVEEIRRSYSTGAFKQKDLAVQFGVTQSSISHIVRGARWKDSSWPR